MTTKKQKDRTEAIDLRVNLGELHEVTLALMTRRSSCQGSIDMGVPWPGGRHRVKRLAKLVEMFEGFEKLVTVQREAEAKYEAERAKRLAARAPVQS